MTNYALKRTTKILLIRDNEFRHDVSKNEETKYLRYHSNRNILQMKMYSFRTMIITTIFLENKNKLKIKNKGVDFEIKNQTTRLPRFGVFITSKRLNNKLSVALPQSSGDIGTAVGERGDYTTRRGKSKKRGLHSHWSCHSNSRLLRLAAPTKIILSEDNYHTAILYRRQSLI